MQIDPPQKRPRNTGPPDRIANRLTVSRASKSQFVNFYCGIAVHYVN